MSASSTARRRKRDLAPSWEPKLSSDDVRRAKAAFAREQDPHARIILNLALSTVAPMTIGERLAQSDRRSRARRAVTED